MLNSELKTKWLTALKSGEYKKGKNALRNTDNTYCCLGVLCDLLHPDRWSDIPYMGSYNYCPTGGGQWHELLPDKEAMNLGIPDQVILSEMNDNTEDWDEVIEYIEEYL